MLGKRVNKLREALGWSQVRLAQELNVSKQTVSNWENGNILPSVDMLIRISAVFNVSTDYILGLESIPRLNVEGLPENIVAHISLLINDFRKLV